MTWWDLLGNPVATADLQGQGHGQGLEQERAHRLVAGATAPRALRRNGGGGGGPGAVHDAVGEPLRDDLSYASLEPSPLGARQRVDETKKVEAYLLPERASMGVSRGKKGVVGAGGAAEKPRPRWRL